MRRGTVTPPFFPLVISLHQLPSVPYRVPPRCRSWRSFFGDINRSRGSGLSWNMETEPWLLRKNTRWVLEVQESRDCDLSTQQLFTDLLLSGLKSGDTSLNPTDESSVLLKLVGRHRKQTEWLHSTLSRDKLHREEQNRKCSSALDSPGYSFQLYQS